MVQREVQEGVPRAPGSTLGTGAVVTLSPHLCVLPALTGGIRKRAEMATTTFPSSRPLQSSWKAPLSCLFLSVSPDWVHVEKRQNVQGRNGEALAPGREEEVFPGWAGLKFISIRYRRLTEPWPCSHLQVFLKHDLIRENIPNEDCN